MKVAITVEFDEMARIAVGLKTNKVLKAASRDECREWVLKVVNDIVANEQQVIQLAFDALLQQGFSPVPESGL